MLKHLQATRPSRPLFVGMLLLGAATLGLPTLTGTTATGQDDRPEPAAPAETPSADRSQRLSELEEQMRDLLNEIHTLREQSKGTDSSFLRHHIAADCAVCHAQPPVHHGFRFHDRFAPVEPPWRNLPQEQSPSADLTVELPGGDEKPDSLPFVISGLILETDKLIEVLRELTDQQGMPRRITIGLVHAEAPPDAGKDDRRAKYTIEGDISGDGLPGTSWPALATRELKRLKQLSGAETLTIRAARDTATDEVLDLIDTAKTAGFTKVRFAAPESE